MRNFTAFLLLGLMAFSPSVQASPDVDFPQPGYSYGGKVRSGPGMQFRQVGSLREGDDILILNGTGTMMNGYEWFEIRYQNGRTGFQWGGIMCSQTPYPTIFRVCDGPRLQTNVPVDNTPSSGPATVNGFSVGQVLHPGGSFTNTRGVQWQEADAQGRVTFHFREESRDEGSVYLFDASRNVSLQLDLHRRQVLYGLGTEPKTVLYPITQSSAQGGHTRASNGRPQSADSTTVQYSCPEGLPLTVTYVNSGNGHVIFSIDGSPQRRLDQVVSGSGSRYTDGRFTLLSKGNTATLQTPSGVDKCIDQ